MEGDSILTSRDGVNIFSEREGGCVFWTRKNKEKFTGTQLILSILFVLNLSRKISNNQNSIISMCIFSFQGFHQLIHQKRGEMCKKKEKREQLQGKLNERSNICSFATFARRGRIQAKRLREYVSRVFFTGKNNNSGGRIKIFKILQT